MNAMYKSEWEGIGSRNSDSAPQFQRTVGSALRHPSCSGNQQIAISLTWCFPTPWESPNSVDIAWLPAAETQQVRELPRGWLYFPGPCSQMITINLLEPLYPPSRNSSDFSFAISQAAFCNLQVSQPQWLSSTNCEDIINSLSKLQGWERDFSWREQMANTFFASFFFNNLKIWGYCWTRHLLFLCNCFQVAPWTHPGVWSREKGRNTRRSCHKQCYIATVKHRQIV